MNADAADEIIFAALCATCAPWEYPETHNFVFGHCVIVCWINCYSVNTSLQPKHGRKRKPTAAISALPLALPPARNPGTSAG